MSPSPEMAASTSIDSPFTRNQGGGPAAGSVVSPYMREKNMYRESERRKTFDNWSIEFLRGEAMAKAGFYYLNTGDLVRCPFCAVEVNNWEENDDPLADHKKWSPRCKFIVNPLSSGNIPVENETQSDLSPQSIDSGYDTCGPYIDNTEFVNKLSETMSVQVNQKPHFPEYSILEKRLMSFQMWPVSLKIKPKELSEAGFFYTGKGDQTICFFCGGGLKDWEDNDDPWVEHAKWFSKCSFVILSKGRGFVDKVCDEHLASKVGRQNQVTANSSSIEKNESSSSSSVKSSSASQDGGQPSSDGSKVVPDAHLCKVCYTNEMGVVFLPCGHLMACVSCAINLTTCGVCRAPIASQLRTFLS